MNAIQTAERIAQDLADQGAQAVVLTGSHARRDAAEHSDIDLVALGAGTSTITQRDGHLVVVSWNAVDVVCTSFGEPYQVGLVIPGWRRALILHDPSGIAAALQVEANTWTWDRIGSAHCDALVTDDITGFAEEVHKLVNALAQDWPAMAAIQRNVLAMRLPVIMALHHRLLCETENRLWDMVARHIGGQWADAMRRALGLGGESFSTTCTAALDLYVLSAAEVDNLLDAQQRRIVEHACRIARSI